MHQDAHGVGANADEGSVAKTHHAAKAQDQIQAGGCQGKDQHATCHANVEVFAQTMRNGGKQGQQHQQRKAPAQVQAVVEDAGSAHAFDGLHGGRHQPWAGKSPCGFQKRTAAMST